MSAAERLIRYCRIDTQSDPASDTSPSTEKQFDLARLLVKELKEIGAEDAQLDEYCYVYAHIDANTERPCPTVGFIAHMDTAPDFTGTGVSPRIIYDYDGGDIRLNDTIVTKTENFPQLKELKGKTLMVTDGNTLLGADDKAGITAIMEALCILKDHPEIPHGRIAVAFTPDEEIGRGTEHFNFECFGADFAYTMDGGALRYYADETFNAAAAQVTFHGFGVHPGSAKDRLVNALNVAMEFHALLPAHMRPEHTEGREGFIHLHGMSGNSEEAHLEYIVREHDKEKFAGLKKRMEDALAYIRTVYGEQTAELKITDSYCNMKEYLNERPDVMNYALKAYRAIGIDAECEPVRGGTDGAMLSAKGLPCPNLGTGGGNFHGRYEYCCLEELEQAADLITEIARAVTEGE